MEHEELGSIIPRWTTRVVPVPCIVIDENRSAMIASVEGLRRPTWVTIVSFHAERRRSLAKLAVRCIRNYDRYASRNRKRDTGLPPEERDRLAREGRYCLPIDNNIR